MPGNNPFSRINQALRARRTKALLLPLPREEADQLSLRAHLALDAMARGRGDARAVQMLCHTLLMSGMLAEAGYCSMTPKDVIAADATICSALSRGTEDGVWILPEIGVEQFSAIVTTYDEQLRRAPLGEIALAQDRITKIGIEAQRALGCSGPAADCDAATVSGLLQQIEIDERAAR